MTHTPHFDIFIIGGGINGAGIARDAAGRGYSVCLCDKGDFACGTSSASTKLFHGGLRYLEYFEFRLVREALIEREVLLANMPHISWPMRFVLPLHSAMRFEGETPASRLLSVFMPWLRGRRPDWVIRLGLFLYDHMGGRKMLPATRTLDLTRDPAGKPLKARFRKAFEYSDCWVEDSRLVVLNLRDAAAKGAEILPRTRVMKAVHDGRNWQIELPGEGGARRTVTASVIVNAGGPWIDEILKEVFGRNDPGNIRLVRGSHIVIARKYEHDRCYFFQNQDGRILFAIPYETDYTLIGTTDADQADMREQPRISDAERDYLCASASAYFREPVTADDIVWTYSGVRGLFDDGASDARSATREYIIRRDMEAGNGSLVNLFGGKITTYRKLAEAALEEIGAIIARKGRPWTARASLPGGDFPVDGFEALVARLSRRYPFLAAPVMRRLARHYGTDVVHVLGNAERIEQLGRHFGAGLYEAEVLYLMTNEWARTAEDVLYRRTKLGLRLDAKSQKALAAFIAEQG